MAPKRHGGCAVAIAKTLQALAADGQQSLLLDLMHLATIQTEMAIWLQVQPKIILEVLHQVAKEAALLEFPEYENTYKDIFVRVESTVEENIRDLR